MKEEKNWLLTTMVTLLLILSMIPLITNTVTAALVDYDDHGICGEKVYVEDDGSFSSGERVYMFITSVTSAWTFESDTDYYKTWVANSSGGFDIAYNFPYRDTVGDYGVLIINHSNVTEYLADTANYTHIDFWFTLTDLYKVEVDPEVIYWDDTDRQDFTISIYNWTGTSYSLLKEPVRFIFWEPDGIMDVVNGTTNNGEVDTDALFNWTAPAGNAEANYTLEITQWNDTDIFLADIFVPVRYHLTELSHTSVGYGDEVTITGKLIDGGDDVVEDVRILVVSPTNLSEGTSVVKTSNSGRFSYYVNFDEAGTWYIGTYDTTGGEFRPTDDETTRTIPGFIWYETIECKSQTGSIDVDPDETTKGFNVSFDITCYDHNDDELENAYVYITGIDLYYNGNFQDDDNVTEIGITDEDGWIEIDDILIFDDTGSVTFLFTYDDTFDNYDTDDDGDLEDEDVQPNIYAEKKVTVKSPAAMNVFIDYEGKDRVLLGEIPSSADTDGYDDPPAADDEWGNWSDYIDIQVYGKANDIPKNATITITGCGIDETYDEEDELYEAPDDYGHYRFLISPRQGGILTVTVTNGSLSATEDIEIEGLEADATTSIGDDKKITVDKNETIYFTTDTYYAEVHVLLYDEDWAYLGTLNETIGNRTEGNGKDGIYEFYPDVSHLGYLVISAKEGYEANYSFYGYDIVEIEPEYDLIVTVTEPDAANDTLTAGLEYDIVIEITNLTGYELDYADIDSVIIELLDDDMEVLENQFGTSYTEDSDTLSHDEDNIWTYDDWTPQSNGTVRITVKAWEGKHAGNNTGVTVDWATFEYNPIKLTAGIDLEDVGVEVYAYDALGNIIPEETFEMWWYNSSEDGVDIAVDSLTDPEDLWAGNSTGDIDLDDDGMAMLWFDYVGNYSQSYYAKLNGVNTSGMLEIDYPDFEVTPTVIFVGIVNEVEIIAKDWAGNLLEGVNITFWPSIAGALAAVPDPVTTDEDGFAVLSLEPVATGTLNLSLARGIHYVEGQLNWTNLLTDTTIQVTTKKPLEITVSQSPIFEGETLTVMVKSEGDPVEDVSVHFGTETKTTDADGEATFTAPNPGVESAVYIIKAEKTGYITDSLSITVIKVWHISIIGPSESPSSGEEFTITIIAKGSPLAGATITFDGKTYTSGGDGKVTLTAPEVDEEEEFTITATFDPYMDGTLVITVTAGGIPGFELVALIAALGVAFILLRRRR
jgi:hypothetical protein